MSHYEYHEFLALDRPLTSDEIAALRSISSRADITTRSFANEYNYSSLRGDPRKILEAYFDVYVYVTSWGSRRLAMRFPKQVVTAEQVAHYCVEEQVDFWATDDHLCLDFVSESEENEGWVEGPGWMDTLAPARHAILHGDDRPLYLGWLAAVECGRIDDEEEEPPVPDGLRDPEPWVESLASFLHIDEHLLSAAAEASGARQFDGAALEAWVRRLSPAERDALLVRVARGEHATVAASLRRRFRINQKAEAAPDVVRRVAGDLRERGLERWEEASRERARKAEEEFQRKRALERAARERRLERLASCQEHAWEDVVDLVESRAQVSYGKAVGLLVDLRDVADGESTEASFERRLEALVEEHRRKHTFVKRLRDAGLVGDEGGAARPR